ncbi:MAG: hypothetical protein IBX70_14500 [Clostridia bacterium]|nr:hypothetical protein [Clostridia bacterium]
MNNILEYDEQELLAVNEQQTNELIAALLNYAQGLENQVVLLRSDLNKRTLADEAQPYPDLHTDIYETFEGYPAYERNKDGIEAYLEFFKNR